ncbi:MAG: HesA/MoeB/ThiF family protein [Clostridia bacterium]
MLEAIAELDRLGFLYNSIQEQQLSLTDIQKERYQANIHYYSMFTDLQASPGTVQQKLLDSKITIIGMGAFGSSILVNLAGLGFKQIRIVDFDRVELSNLNRQILFTEKDIGRLKVDVAKQFLAQFNSDIDIEAIPMQVTSVEDADSVIAGSDFVVLAADHPPFLLPRWINTACISHGIPYITGGIHLTDAVFYTIVPGKTACGDCLLLNRTRQSEQFPQVIKSVLEANLRLPTATIAPNLMMVTGMMVSDLLRSLGNLGPVESEGKIITFDMTTYEKKMIEPITAEPECPTCGQGTGDHPLFNLFETFEKRLFVT